MQGRRRENKWFIEIAVLLDATVHGKALGMTEVDDDSWFTRSAPGDLNGGNNERRPQGIH